MSTTSQEDILRECAPLGTKDKVERLIVLNNDLKARLDQETLEMVWEANALSMDILTAHLKQEQ